MIVMTITNIMTRYGVRKMYRPLNDHILKIVTNRYSIGKEGQESSSWSLNWQYLPHSLKDDIIFLTFALKILNRMFSDNTITVTMRKVPTARNSSSIF
jgi:hypothetical protein